MSAATVSALTVVKPLYEVPKFGLHRYLAYTINPMEKLGVISSRAHLWLLYKHLAGELNRIVILHVDDSLISGSKIFSVEEELESKSFVSKPWKKLTAQPELLNGLTIWQQKNGTKSINQNEKIEKLKRPESHKEFFSQRALAQDTGVNCRPDICAVVQLIPPDHGRIRKSH